MAEAAREPDRSRLREVFREFELRDPLRAPGGGLRRGRRRRGARARSRRSRSRRGCARARWPTSRGFERGKEVTVAVVAPETPEGQLVRRPTPTGASAWPPARTCSSARCDGPEELVAALGDRPVVAHDAKALGVVPPGLTHDTLLAAYLLEPARRGFPFREICEERGLASDVDDPAGADAVVLQALAAWQREQLAERGLESLHGRGRAAARARCCATWRSPGVRLNRERLAEIDERVRDEIARPRARDLGRWPARSSSIGSPQQLGAVLFEKLGLSRKRRGKTGFSTDARVLQAIRDEHEIIPKIERWRELNQILKTYLDVLPAARPTPSRACTRPSCRRPPPPAGWPRPNPNMQNVPVRTELGREIRGCFEAAPGNVLISADYSQVELRVLAHIADEPVLKEIFVRGEDVHTATGSVVFGKDPSELDADGPLEVEDDQLRDRLRPQRLRPRRPPEHPARGGQGVHRRLPRALPAGRRVHRARRSSSAASRAT